jgi:hypothetical protein
MSRKSFVALLVLSLGVTLLAVIVRLTSPDYTGPALGTDIALKDMTDRINDVGTISILTEAGTLTLTRDENGAWLVEEPGGYPANTQKVQETVLALSRLTLHEKKTADPDRYHRLELNSPGKGTQVFITTDDGTALVDAVIGKRVTAQSGLPTGGVYVRLGDDKQTWLAAGPLDLGVDSKDWIETRIASVAEGRVLRVTYYHSDGETVLLERTSAGFQLLDTPVGYKIDSEYRLNSIPAFLEDLTIDGVRAGDNPGPALVTAAFETTDGLRVDVDLFGNENAGYLLRIDASGQTVETQAEADRIKARTNGWLFDVADWKSNALKHRMGDLITPEEETP